MLAHTLTQTEKFNFESSIYLHIIQIQDTGILMPSIKRLSLLVVSEKYFD